MRWKAAMPLALVSIVFGLVRGRVRGYNLGTKTTVRCRQGHLFTTVWIPGATVKSLRLGSRRFQRCPVGRHWSLVQPVRIADLSEEEKRDAAAHRDIRLP